MNILIKQAKVVSSTSGYNGRIVDILIENGKITEIKKTIPAKGNVKLIECEGLCVSTGWVDMQAASGDPGFEHKETLDTLIECAASGGFTAVCVHSCNEPALHTKSQIEYIINKTKNKAVRVLPFGTITVDARGKDMAEMYDMKIAGAAAFSDYKHSIKDAGMVLRALQYASNIDALIITHCNDESIPRGGQMNEGEVAVTLGLKGSPALAEELMIQRNLSILEYTGGKLHIPTISSKGSIELIKTAKTNGLNVTAGVAAANLSLNDSALKDFDTNYKTEPPLRTKKDAQALCNALASGIIDVVVSDHYPQDIESKELEFDLAEPGIINLQTAFACALEGMKEKNIEMLIKSFTDNPRMILGMEMPEIEEQHEANLTMFSLIGETTFNESLNKSRSKNSPFINKVLKGRVIGIINGSKSFFN